MAQDRSQPAPRRHDEPHREAAAASPGLPEPSLRGADGVACRQSSERWMFRAGQVDRRCCLAHAGMVCGSLAGGSCGDGSICWRAASCGQMMAVPSGALSLRGAPRANHRRTCWPDCPDGVLLGIDSCSNVCRARFTAGIIPPEGDPVSRIGAPGHCRPCVRCRRASGVPILSGGRDLIDLASCGCLAPAGGGLRGRLLGPRASGSGTRWWHVSARVMR